MLDLPRRLRAIAIHRTRVPLGVLILSLAGVAWWAQSLQIRHDNLSAEKLARKAAEFSLKLGERMRAYEQVLWGAAGLFAAKTEVSRADWHAYIERLHLHERYPGILAIGYAQVLSAHELPAHVRSVRLQGYPAYRVRPEGERAYYTSIVYVEPFAGLNLRAFGYDMSSESVRAEAMERASDTGRAAISGRVTLLQDDPAKPNRGLLLYVPVYRPGAPIATLEQRRLALQGYVYIAYFAADLLSSIVGPNMDDVAIDVYDQVRSPEALLFDTNPETSPRVQHESELRQSLRSMNVAGRRWDVAYRAGPSADEPRIDEGSRLVLALGTVASLLLFGVVLAITRTKDRAQALAERMTAELRAKRAELEAVNDNAPIGIFRASADANAIYINRRGAQICDMSEDELQQFRWVNRLHPDDRQQVATSWKQFVERGDSFSSEHRFVHRDGRVVWVRVKAVPMRERDVVIGFTGTVEDISAQREQNLEVERSRRFLEDLINAIPNALFVKDRMHRWVIVNDAFCRFHALSREQLLGKTDADLLPVERVQAAFAEDDEVFATRKDILVEQYLNPPAESRTGDSRASARFPCPTARTMWSA
jgi:PAS domain S-box-containing protein